MNIQNNSLTQCTVEFLHWVIQVILKLFCLKLGLYSFTQFLLISESPFLQVKVSIVNSAGGSFCWNYATDTFYSNYAGTNVCCNYAGFEVLLQLCWWYFLLHLCWLIFLSQFKGDCMTPLTNYAPPAERGGRCTLWLQGSEYLYWVNNILQLTENGKIAARSRVSQSRTGNEKYKLCKEHCQT